MNPCQEIVKLETMTSRNNESNNKNEKPFPPTLKKVLPESMSRVISIKKEISTMENTRLFNPNPVTLTTKEYQIPLWLQEVLKELRFQYKNKAAIRGRILLS
jgi:hypothetical protein